MGNAMSFPHLQTHQFSQYPNSTVKRNIVISSPTSTMGNAREKNHRDRDSCTIHSCNYGYYENTSEII
jgi:hypothetical protein